MKKLKALCVDWHEDRRAEFETRFKNLDYDHHSPHTFIIKRGWANLLEGRGDEHLPWQCFAVELESGKIFRTNHAGIPQLDKFIGYLEDVTGNDLNERRFV